MANWKETTEESKNRWQANADYWDETMGVNSNQFHREIVRPSTEELLAVKIGERVLDIACGNGNFSKRLVELGAKVTAYYSAKMIENAKKRCAHCIDEIDFRVLDATDYSQLMGLMDCGPFDKAVANMALMDIADIDPLFRAVNALLIPGGRFVFSCSHPCFQTPGVRKIVETEEGKQGFTTRNGLQLFQYMTPKSYEGIALVNQPTPHIYYHRSLSLLLGTAFAAGFSIDGFAEPGFTEGKMVTWSEFPPIIIVALRK